MYLLIQDIGEKVDIKADLNICIYIFVVFILGVLYFCTTEIWNTAHLTPFFDKAISIKYSLPANTITNG